MVVATDSKYVVDGITTYVQKWTQNDWKTHRGTS